MSDTKIDIISRDVEFVKDMVQDVGYRVTGLESAFTEQSRIIADHVATDKQMYLELHRMNDILEKNTQSLSEHIRRTELNELAIHELKNMNINFDRRLVPIEHSHIEKVGIAKFWRRAGMVFGGLASVSSIIYTILHAMNIVP